MKFKARLKGVLASALAAILVFSAAATAHAETGKVTVINKTSSVTVHVYDNSSASEDYASGEEIADASKLGTAVSGATLTYYEVGKLVQHTEDGRTSLKYAVSEDTVGALGLTAPSAPIVSIESSRYYLCDASDLQDMIAGKTSSDIRSKAENPDLPNLPTHDTDATNGDGAVTVNGLSGLYLFIGKSMPSHTTTEVVPFFVSAPMPAGGEGWNTTIHVYPKIQTTGKITIEHKVHYHAAAAALDADDYVPDMSAESGTELEYRIVLNIPGAVKNLKSLDVDDTLPEGLELVADSAAATASYNGFEAGDYTISSTGNIIDFSLTEAGRTRLDSVQGNETITITYRAKIGSDASLATTIDSTAKLTYEFNASAGGTDDATATVYTYGIDLTKIFGGTPDAFPADAQFALYRDASCSEDKAVKVTADSAGTYRVAAAGSGTAMTVVQKGGDIFRGALVLKGIAEGTYYLKEVQAPEGYSRLQDPIVVTVSKGSGDNLSLQVSSPTATADGVKATVEGGLVKLTVENQPLLFGFLPRTGDAGTLAVTAVGLGMVALAIIFVAGRRNRAAVR